MSTTLKLSILSPERRLVDREEVQSVTLFGSEGQIQILPGHSPMVGNLEAGMFSYESVRGKTTGVVSGGFFEIVDGHLSVMADTIELLGEIDLSRAKTAQQKAEAALAAVELDPHAFKTWQLKLQRSLIRQQLAGKDHPEV